MIEGHRKNQGHYKEQDQNVFVRGADNEQTEEADQQNHQLRRHHVRQDRAHKKPILALEKRVAVRAVMPNVKRVCDDLRFATGGAA